jgi:hypothetical protein
VSTVDRFAGWNDRADPPIPTGDNPTRGPAAGLPRRPGGAARPVWLRPYGERGEWAEVAEDPLLLAALGGVAARNPATWDCPVAPVTATTTHLHGALGAAAAIAALLGRRQDGGCHWPVSGSWTCPPTWPGR